MRARPLALLVLLLLAPSANASWLSPDPVEVTVATPRVGDLLSYARDSHWYSETSAEGERSAWSEVALLEGPSRATDAFGIERDTYSSLVERSDNTGLLSRERCHWLAGGEQAVRRDVLAGWAYDERMSWSSETLGVQVDGGAMAQKTRVVAMFIATPCQGAPGLAGLTLREGEAVPFRVLDPSSEREDVSSPAVATKFHGRSALTLTFDDERHGTVSVTLADGLPGVVASKVEILGASHGYFGNSTLTGFVAGGGEPIAGGDAKLPARHPEDVLTPDVRQLDDTPLGLALPFAVAYQAALDDPRSTLRAWLDAHPRAFLSSAFYDADIAELGGTRGPRWDIMWLQDGESANAYVMRPSSVETPAGGFALPTQSPMQVRFFEGRMDPPGKAPAAILGGEGIARFVRQAGIPEGSVRTIEFALMSDDEDGTVRGYLGISQLSTQEEGTSEGRMLVIDPLVGKIEGVYEAVRDTERTGVLALTPMHGGLEKESPGTLAALAGPGVGSLGVPAAATGLALLILFVKFLAIPLFTRLRRDRLLDNPVRARLYERVRREPGLHRAELVDFAGIGEGATRHHLRQLVSHRLLVELDVDGYARYFAAGEVPPEVARREATLRAGSRRAVYDLYAREPALPLRAAAARLGMSAPSVHRAKRQLQAAGLLPAARSAEASVEA